MIISPRSFKCDFQDNTCSIRYYNNAIKLVTKTRLLAVVIGNRLSWSDQVDAVCSKVGRKIGALQRSIRQLSLPARQAFLLSVIQPDLEYAASATVFSMSASLRDRLIAVWKRAVRCAAGAGSFESFQPLLKDLRITPLIHRWILQLATLVRRCQRGAAPAILVDRLITTSHSYSTCGCDSTFRPPLCTSLSGSASFSNRAPSLRNASPREVRNAPSPSAFKSKLLSSLTNFDLSQKKKICFRNPALI